jgi:hypothetical protein
MQLTLVVNAVRFLGPGLRLSPTLAAQRLFLRKQLALALTRVLGAVAG